MKDFVIKEKRKTATTQNEELLSSKEENLLKKYGYCSFNLSNEQFKEILSRKIKALAGAFGSLKGGLFE